MCLLQHYLPYNEPGCWMHPGEMMKPWLFRLYEPGPMETRFTTIWIQRAATLPEAGLHQSIPHNRHCQSTLHTLISMGSYCWTRTNKIPYFYPFLRAKQRLVQLANVYFCASDRRRIKVEIRNDSGPEDQGENRWAAMETSQTEWRSVCGGGDGGQRSCWQLSARCVICYFGLGPPWSL